MQTLNIELAAGQTRPFEISGQYWEILVSPYDLDVIEFFGPQGEYTESLRGVSAGIYRNAPFRGFSITNGGTAQTIKILFGDGTAGNRAAPLVGPLTDQQLRAAPVPVSGPVTDAQLRAAPVPVAGPVTDAQLRAAPVPVAVMVAGGCQQFDVSAAAETVAVVDAARKREHLLILNTSAFKCWLMFTGADAGEDVGLPLESGQSVEFSGGWCPSAKVTAYSTTAVGLHVIVGL